VGKKYELEEAGVSSKEKRFIIDFQINVVLIS